MTVPDHAVCCGPDGCKPISSLPAEDQAAIEAVVDEMLARREEADAAVRARAEQNRRAEVMANSQRGLFKS